MSAHYPFSGKANRVSVFAFFEHYQLGLELQEKYYQWWHAWAKDFVMKDPDLRATKAVMFEQYPIGQHAHKNFHLHDYAWATPTLELGEFIERAIFPKLSDEALHRLEIEHKNMLEALLTEREAKPRKPAPDIGRYRHT